MSGPQNSQLVQHILKELRRHPDGIWVRKLARILHAPLTTVHRYVTVQEKGYPGTLIEITRQLPKERGGHIMIRLKRGR